MFTGIVEEIGTVLAVQKGTKAIKMHIQGKVVLEDTRLGDSICTNGVCLTVTQLYKDSFEVDIMPETALKSNLGDLKKGSLVHLERALTLQSRLGGHMVSGHIDGTGIIKAVTKDENATWLTIGASEELLKYMIYKGSIAIDGVSLTIAQLGEADFKVSLIPHTSSHTHLLHKKIGETVNLECDMVGKYVERMMQINAQNKQKETALTKDFLAKYDFL